ncbi:MAG: ABC transporter substrate-binding protein [Roseovarius sp.]|nr:ABC transporter substrate-binding protein [Roseovarius sp.]MCY4314951.1 ABC transporter substrate-binding protein [Roseovarius sp.]
MTLVRDGLLGRRGFLKTAAATAVAASLPFSAARAAPKRGGHLRIGVGHGQTTDTLNPGLWEAGFMIPWSFGVHGRLTEVGPDGSLLPELAESWEASADATEWRFKIRKGVQFHSGHELNVQDVVNSINFHRGEGSASAAGPIVAPVEEISTEGDDTVVFKLSGGNADFPFILTDYHLAICKADGDSIDWQSGDGCGAYKMKSIDFGVQATMERNENHWRDDVAWFDSFEMLALVDLNARTTALVSGDVDAIDRLDLKTVGLLGRRPGVKIHSISGTAHYTMPMDVRRAPYDDNNVRQALKYGINRQELVDKILFGYGSPGNDHPIGSGQRYFNSELERKTYDPDKARWYLQQAGIDNLKVNLSTSDAAFGGAVDAAVLFQASGKAAGLDINVVREPNDGYWSDIWMKKEFVFSYWGGRPVEDQMFATAYSCDASWNESFWCHERFEELMVAARAELDDGKRREMYWEMQDICANEGGSIIPMFNDYVFAVSDRLGLPDVMGSNWDLDGNRFMERWWFA